LEAGRRGANLALSRKYWSSCASVYATISRARRVGAAIAMGDGTTMAMVMVMAVEG
jgi:hypothetical protein